MLDWALRVLDELLHRRDADGLWPGKKRWEMSNGWRVTGQCGTPFSESFDGFISGEDPTPHDWSGNTSANNCLVGQAMQPWAGVRSSRYHNCIIFGARYAVAGGYRYQTWLAAATDWNNGRPVPNEPVVTWSGGNYSLESFPTARPIRWAVRPADEFPQSREVGDGSDLDDDMKNEVETWTVNDGGPPSKTIVTTAFPDRRLPPPNVKERKIALSLENTARRIVDWTTEARDFVDSLWEAIPSKGPAHRTRMYWKPGYKQAWSVPLPEKMMQIWRYWDYLDKSGKWKEAEGQKYMSNAFANVFTDNVQDFVYGNIGRISGRASRRLGRPAGIQTGPVF